MYGIPSHIYPVDRVKTKLLRVNTPQRIFFNLNENIQKISHLQRSRTTVEAHLRL
jgi:hypothetical protein